MRSSYCWAEQQRSSGPSRPAVATSRAMLAYRPASGAGLVDLGRHTSQQGREEPVKSRPSAPRRVLSFSPALDFLLFLGRVDSSPLAGSLHFATFRV